MGYTQKTTIVGAGISGLACAYRLKQLGFRPLVLEAADRAGGVIATVRRNGFLFETGPQFPRFPAPVWRLVRDLGLESEFMAGNPKAERYILRHGRLHTVPFSPKGLFTTRLVGLKSKLRILTEPFGYSHPPHREESLADFVERKFGLEVLNNLVDPLISTIFLGDSSKMGMESAFPALVEWERARGSVARGALYARWSRQRLSAADSSTAVTSRNVGADALRVTDALPTLGSFKSGMGTLPEKLADVLRDEIVFRSRVVSVARVPVHDADSSAKWDVGLPEGQQISTEYLVLAVPAYVAARLLQIDAPQIAASLNAIEYAPISVVGAAYDSSTVKHPPNGFGFMVPRCEKLKTICTFWNSSLFAGRAPQGTVLLTSFARNDGSEGSDATSDQESAKVVEAENARILGISGECLDRVVWSAQQALPQYNLGHARRVAEIFAGLKMLPNLHLVGNFLNGRSIGDCVESGFRAAEDVCSQLRRENI